MANSKFKVLRNILQGNTAKYKIPTERPTLRLQRQAFESFYKAASTLYQSQLRGNTERLDRLKDYDEMDLVPEISKALDIFSDDSLTYNESGQVLAIVTDDAKIKRALEELYYEILDVDFHLWHWVRNLCKYGDHFNLLDVVEGEGVLGALELPVGEIEREEGFDNDPNSLRFKWLAQHGGADYFENYQVSHMRMLGEDKFLPYGKSILDPGRKLYKQLIMAEDAMLIYRITRAPERRVFYIDVANIPPKDVDSFIQKARDALKRSTNIRNPNTGTLDMRYNPESILEDFFIPVRGDRSSRIETLPGGDNASAIEDIQYLQNKLFIALGVPKSYLTAEEDLSGKCLHPETKIPLLNGRTLSIENISKIYEEEDLYTYAVDEKTKEIVPGKVLWAGKTRKNATLVEVTLDNGEKIKCTPDHKFMLRDGTYKEAQLLESEESLMPLYRRITGVDTGKRNLIGYEETYNPATKKYEYTHRLVDSWKYKNGHSIKNRRVVHHIDFDKLNNSPDNLVEMSFDDHRQLHQDVLSETRQKALQDGKYSGQNNGWARKCRENVQHLWDIDKLIDFCDDPKVTAKKHIVSDYGLTETQLKNMLNEFGFTYKDFANKYMNGGYKLGLGHKKPGYKRTVTQYLGGNQYGRFVAHNHKVVSVEFIEEKVDCYDLTIEGNPNFGLHAGVVVHNSTLAQEDIKFARTIQRVQKIVVSELAKIGLVHLYLKGYDQMDIYNFDLKLTNPSSVTELMQLELIEKRLDIAERMHASPLISNEYAQKNIMKLTESEISEFKLKAVEEAKEQFKLEQITTGGANDPEYQMEMGGDMGGGYEEDGGGEEGAPPSGESKRMADRETASDNIGFPYDPTGTKHLKGYPDLEASVPNSNDPFDKIFDDNDSSELLITKKRGSNNKDLLNRTITDIKKHDRGMKRVLSKLGEDINGGFLIESKIKNTNFVKKK